MYENLHKHKYLYQRTNAENKQTHLNHFKNNITYITQITLFYTDSLVCIFSTLIRQSKGMKYYIKFGHGIVL